VLRRRNVLDVNDAPQLVVAPVRGWSQAHAACFLGTHQQRVSDLRHGRIGRFSLEQLIRFVSRVDGNVLIRVEWAAHSILFEQWGREREQGSGGAAIGNAAFGRDA